MKYLRLLCDYLSRIISRKDGSVRAIWKLILWVELFVVLMALWEVLPWRPDLRGLEYVLIILLPSLFLFRVVEGRRFRSFGLSISRGWLRELGFGIFFGIAAITIVFLCLILTGNAKVEWNAGTIGKLWISGWILLLLFVPTQELLFRGYPLIVLVRSIGKPAALLVTSIAFGLYHFSGGPLGWLNLTLLGVAMGITFFRTGRLWAAIGLHYGWNLFQSLVFNFIPNYVPIPQESIFRTTLTGGKLLVGDDFGVEASILSTPVLLVLVVLALKAPYFSNQESISSPFSTPVRPLRMLGNAVIFVFAIAGPVLYVGVHLPGTRPLFKERPKASLFELYERQEPADTEVSVESIVLSLTNTDKGSLNVALSSEADSEQKVTVAIRHSWRGWIMRAMGTKKTSDTLRPASQKVITFQVGLRDAQANAKIKVTVHLSRELKTTDEPGSLLFQKSFHLRDFVR